MRKIIDEIFKIYNVKYKRDTICYCKYGHNTMKPTDIWHNTNWIPINKMCCNKTKYNNYNNGCNHQKAKRGSSKGI